MKCLSAGPWSTVVSTHWETTLLKAVFLKLDHHLTWDPEFHIENDEEIYERFHEWLFNRHLPTNKRMFQFIVVYMISYVLCLILYTALHHQWVALIVIAVTHCAMFPFFLKYAKTFVDLDAMRSIRRESNSDQAMQSLKEDAISLNKVGTFKFYSDVTMKPREADIVFAQGCLIPFLVHCTITTAVDIMHSSDTFLLCFPLTLLIFVSIRCSLAPINLQLCNKTDAAVFGLSVLTMGAHVLFNPRVVWDEGLCVVLSLCVAIGTSRYFGELMLDSSRKEFKRKNTMMIERYKTESLVQKVLPQKIAQQMRQSERRKGWDIVKTQITNHKGIDLMDGSRKKSKSSIAAVPIHNKYATVAFIKISLFDSNYEKVDDNQNPEIVVNSLHQIVKKFDKIIFLYSGVHKVEHVANTYLLCSGLLEQAIPDDVHPQTMLHACIALQDICSKIRLKDGRTVQITVGIHSGNVLGTVVGAQRRFFRIFGDTVNTASRICSTGIKYKINVSDVVHQCSPHLKQFHWEKRENVSMKGKGTMNCLVLQRISESRNSMSLNFKFQTSRLQSMKNGQRHSQPRWMVKGSICIKQNTKQSSTVFVSRLAEVGSDLSHHPLTLWFRDTRHQRRDSQGSSRDSTASSIAELQKMEDGTRSIGNKEVLDHRASILSSDCGTSMEDAFRNEWFQKRKRIANWFLFIAYIFSLSCFLVYLSSNLYYDNGFLPMVLPLTTIFMASTSYWSQSLFLSYQMRKTTNICECLTVLFSSLTTMSCLSYFEMSWIHNIDVLFLVVSCASLSKMSHSLNITICCMLVVSHIAFFWWQIQDFIVLYVVIASGASIVFSSMKYRIEYKLRELFIVNLAYQRDQVSITRELSTLLPGFVIERMIGSQLKCQQIVDKFNNATIFESDLVGFTKFSSTRTPVEIVRFLNGLYTKLDAECVTFGLEKIDTIGDAYICVNFTGSPDPVLQFALKLVQDICDQDDVVGMRVGIATGYVIGTVLGECTKRYALFGAALNRAIKLEERSENKQILCCSNTKKKASKRFGFEPFSKEKADKENDAFWLRDISSKSVIINKREQ